MSTATRHCKDCDKPFVTKCWFRLFCSPLCRLRSHRRKQREIEVSVVEQNRVASESLLTGDEGRQRTKDPITKEEV